jgi:hypothetical protein
MSEVHELSLNGPEEEGITEWVCHDCGRKMLVSRFPEFSRVIVNEGDSTIQHVAIWDNKRIISVKANTMTLNPETKWLLDNGIDWDSNG